MIVIVKFNDYLVVSIFRGSNFKFEVIFFAQIIDIFNFPDNSTALLPYFDTLFLSAHTSKFITF